MTPEEVAHVGGQFADGQRRLDDAATALIEALDGLAGCAGGDSTGESFAARVDPAVRSLIGILESGVSTFGGLAGGLVATARNYAAAEHHSTPQDTGSPDEFGAPGVIDLVVYPTPGSMAGGRVEGVNRFLARYWPHGDPGRLRAVATAFTAAGSALRSLGTDAQRCVDALLESNISPALDGFGAVWTLVWGDSGGSMGHAVDTCSTLADACSHLADQIDRAHHALEEAAAAVGIVTAAGLVLTIFSAGLSDAIAAELDSAIAVDATVIASEFAVEVAAGVEEVVDLELVPLLDAAAAALPDIQVATAETTQVEAEFAETRVLARVGGGSEQPPGWTGGGGSSGSRNGPGVAEPAPAPGGGGTRPPGKPPIPVPGPIGPGDGGRDDEGFNAAEQKIAEKLTAEGHHVEHVYNDPSIASPDALVDGVPTEFMTLQPTSGPVALRRAIETAAGQASQIVVDTTGTSITEDEVVAVIRRVFGGHYGDRISSVRVFGDDFDLVRRN